jgi:hypothetical protein
MLMSGPGWVKFSNEWAVSTVVTGLVAGTYSFELSVTDSKGVTTNSSPVKVVVKAAAKTAAVAPGANVGQAITMTDSAGLGDPAVAGQTPGLQLYPNPARDLLNIRLSDSITGKIIVAIFDTRGARVSNLETDKQSWTLDLPADVSRLPQGMYLLQIISSSGQRTIGKFIKQ